MTITFIAHSTPEPAFYGALAAILAELRALPLCHLPVSYDSKHFINSRQYISPQGHQMTSGLLWLERLTGRGAGAEFELGSLINRAVKEDIVVPLNQPLCSPCYATMIQRIRENGIAIESLQVVKNQDRYQLEDCVSGKVRSNGWARDNFGRWVLGGVTQPVMRAGKALRLGILGDFNEHRDSYPATLAALGDAADALAMNIEVVYITPNLVSTQLDSRLFDLDGLLLPGISVQGADNVSVSSSSQLAVARWALDNQAPVLGINSGMHMMVAALGQKILGDAAVAMPGPSTLNALQCSLPLADQGMQRGNRKVIFQSGSRMAKMMGKEAQLRYNQRWRLSPQLLDKLACAGLQVTGSDESGLSAESVELENHPFFIGVQGHPELQSRRERPHPLLLNFLQQVRQINKDRDISHPALTRSVRLKHPHFLMG
ncbi:MAG: gamma-glutamyl-gamma-aminobutyrate hydrolase family protein [Rouxiella aceris]|uniref:glutamine amidotransferase-related protein n=1 Tax=Rouxiella aceris TaxID=2703884 RepID=UPI0028518D7C|nr:gamma-glutamyl-gamma-aminobutyrate hydrolase family protein [Rouxiella aceris]MDR3432203.1 gamma-glutamyl-gamma-aminobutyrate hydrolase family protein [Rouxiella aceris]